MNIVPREFQGQQPEGPQAPSVFGVGTSRGTIFTRIPPRLFHILPFFRNPALVTGILLQPILPLGSIVVNIPLDFYNIDSVNPSILGRDLERMYNTCSMVQ